MTTYKILQKHKEQLVREYADYVKAQYPTRTTEYNKCERDIQTIIDAYSAGIRDKSDFEIKFVLYKFYENNKLQIKSTFVELDVHKKLADKILTLIENTNDREYFIILKDLFLNELENGTTQSPMLFVEKLMMNRATQYSFKSDPIPQDKIDIIYRNANGITPTICNEYNYRVDVVPDRLKQDVFKAAITPFSNPPHDSSALKKARKYNFNGWDSEYSRIMSEGKYCLNPQIFAPLLLCISFPDNGYNQSEWEYYKRFSVSRDQSMLGAAFCAWHIVNIVTELGLDHAFCAGFDTRYASDKLGLTDEGGIQWHPLLFICIGYGEHVKGVHEERLAKHNDIFGKLTFK